MSTATMPLEAIEELLHYGCVHKLIGYLDSFVVRNNLLSLLKLAKPSENLLSTPSINRPLSQILEPIINYASLQNLLINNGATGRELFADKIMGLLTPSQSEIIGHFNILHQNKGIKQATDYFYALSQASNYIKSEAIAKNRSWFYQAPNGKLEITINLSKPEKDPAEIALAKSLPNTGYPQCLLCLHNIGFEGNLNWPSRQNHRVIPLTLGKQHWYLQYSPYLYYNEHAIIFKEEHEAMQISADTFDYFFDFLTQFPHYFIGSNADLPIVGGSILSHQHFQAGCHNFAMATAKAKATFSHSHFATTSIELLDWPLSTIRLKDSNHHHLKHLATLILNAWRSYSNPNVAIVANSEGTPHNTITPIARINNAGQFELDLVLRNNRTTAEHPLGIFHPHSQHHAVKKENIGLIEVMGLAILPPRLLNELELIKAYLVNPNLLISTPIEPNSPLAKHRAWLNELIEQFANSTDNIELFLQQAVGRKFALILDDCGVFKNNPNGFEHFKHFASHLGLIVA